MAQTIAAQARQALESLDQTLLSYARGRNPEQLVGQFLDAEGRLANQSGVYGMGSWIALTREKSEQEVRDLRQTCSEALKEWAEGRPGTHASGGKNVYYLTSVVPKLCYAYIGLRYLPEAGNVTSLLVTRILACQRRSNNCWGFFRDGDGMSPVVTALVIRTFGHHDSFHDRLNGAITYLSQAWEKEANPYMKLYILNTIWEFGNGDKKKEAENNIRETIIRLLNQAFYNPTRFPNPINVDYNDGNETRYIRLAADLILVDSLANISGSKRHFLRGHPGHRILSHLMETMRTPPEKDTTGHRLTLPAALHLQRTLTALSKSVDTASLSAKAWAYLRSALTFGVNVTWNVLAFTFGLVGLLVSIHYANKPFMSAFIGVSAKSLLDVFKSLWNLRRFTGD